MIFEVSRFIFRPPPQIARARRVLIKPHAPYPLPHPVTTSRETLATVIAGIRSISDADILLLEGNPQGEAMPPIYKSLGYDFPRVLSLDVKDGLWVEIDNPLTKPYVLPSVWVPNVLLSCDYWISVAPFRVLGGRGSFTIPNLLGLLPTPKYSWPELYGLGIEKVIADLYFTLPFDLGIIDGRKRLESSADPTQGEVSELGRVFEGEPYQVDQEASHSQGLDTPYLELIRLAKEEFEA